MMLKKINNEMTLFRFYNLPDFIRLVLLYGIFSRAIFIAYNTHLFWIIVILSLGVYFFSVLIFSRFIFYDNHLEISFPTKFWNRKKIVPYHEIKKVNYRPSFRWEGGFVILLEQPKWRPNLARPSNSFPCIRRKNRERLITFLKSKNVEVVLEESRI